MTLSPRRLGRLSLFEERGDGPVGLGEGEGRQVTRTNPANGIVVREKELATDKLGPIGQELDRRAPRLPPAYRRLQVLPMP